MIITHHGKVPEAPAKEARRSKTAPSSQGLKTGAKTLAMTTPLRQHAWHSPQ